MTFTLKDTRTPERKLQDHIATGMRWLDANRPGWWIQGHRRAVDLTDATVRYQLARGMGVSAVGRGLIVEAANQMLAATRQRAADEAKLSAMWGAAVEARRIAEQRAAAESGDNDPVVRLIAAYRTPANNDL